MTDTKYKIVPVEPTEEMIEAGSAAIQSTGFVDQATAYGYAAMLTASPDASQDEGLVDRLTRVACNPDPVARCREGRECDFCQEIARAILKTIEGEG